MHQRHLHPLLPTPPPGAAEVTAATAAFIASATVYNYPPPQFYFGWGPPRYGQQGWWLTSHPGPPAPPLMGYSSSAATINNTFDSINASVAATASIALPFQQQKKFWIITLTSPLDEKLGAQTDNRHRDRLYVLYSKTNEVTVDVIDNVDKLIKEVDGLAKAASFTDL